MLRTFAHGTPSKKDLRLDAWVTAAGHHVCDDFSSKLQARTCTLLAYCVKGKGVLRLGETEYVFGPGSLVVQPAHVEHACWSDPEEGWDLWWLTMGGTYAHKLLQMIGLTPTQPMLSIGHHPLLIEHYISIFDHIEQRTPHTHVELSRLLLSFLLEVVKIQRELVLSKDILCQHIHYQAENVEQIAKAAGYSKYHFIRLFKKATGMTPWNYVLHLKVDKAKDLLLESEHSIKEISVLVGFKSPLYFSRIFKQFTGSSPKAFRSFG